MWKTRLLIISFAGLAAWGWARASMTDVAVRRAQRVEAHESLTRAQAALPALFRIVAEDLDRRVRATADDPGLRAARRSPESAQLYVRRLPRAGTDEDWLLLSREGLTIARSANSAKIGASITAEEGIRDLLAGEPLGGLRRFEGTWRLVSGWPLSGVTGVDGALVVLRRLDGELAHELAEGAGAELAFVDGDRVVGTLPSAALADLRQNGSGQRPGGPVEDVSVGGEAWHTITTRVAGLEVRLMRPQSVGDDVLADLGLRTAEAWLRPKSVGAGLFFGALGLLGLFLVSREARRQEPWVMHPTPAPLTAQATREPVFNDDLDGPDPPIDEEVVLPDEWTQRLEAAVGAVLAEDGPVGDADDDLDEGARTEGYEVLYSQFLQSRLDCGEETVGLSYDSFANRLDDNAAKVRERYDCEDVEFHIQIVDGRAKVKALPGVDRLSA